MRRLLVLFALVWMAVFALGAQERPPVTTAISTPPQVGRFCGNGLYYATLDSELRVYRASTNQLAASIHYVRPNLSFQLSYDGTQLYFNDLYNGVGTVVRFDWTRGTVVPLAKSDLMTAFSVSPNGRYLAMAENDTKMRLKVIDLTTGLLYKQWSLSSTFEIRKIAWLGDSNRFVTPGPNIWNIDGARLVARTPGPAGNNFEISPNGEFVVTRLEATRLALYRTADGGAVWSREVPYGFSFGISSDNAAILVPVNDDVYQGYRIQFMSASTGLALPISLQTAEPSIHIATSPTTQDLLTFAPNEARKYRFFSGSGGGYSTASIEKTPPTLNRLKTIWIRRNDRKMPALAGVGNEGGLYVCHDEAMARFAPTPNVEGGANPFDVDETGAYLAIAQNLNGVYGLHVLNAINGVRLATRTSDTSLEDVQFGRNGRVLATRASSATVYQFSSTGGLTALRTINHFGGNPRLTADGNYILVRIPTTLYSLIRLISVADGSVVREWNMAAESYDRYYDHWTSEDGSFGIATQGNFNAFADFTYSLQLYHLEDGRVVEDRGFSLPAYRFSYIRSRTSPDGKYLAISRSFDQNRYDVMRQPERMLIYRRDDGTLVRDLNGSYLSSGREFAWGKDSRTIHLMRVGTAGIITTPVVWDRNTIYCQPGLVVGGTNSLATISLQSPAPAGGLALTLSDDSAFATLPTSVTIAEGRTSVQVPVATLPVDTDQLVTITASTPSYGFSGVLGIRPPNTLDLTVASDPAPARASVGGSVRINGMAGPAGVKVKLQTFETGRLRLPESVLVPPGATTASFVFETASYPDPGVAQINGRTPDAMGQVTFRLRGDEATIVPVTESIVGGNQGQGKVTILERYTTGSARYALSSNNPNVIVPSSITLSAGISEALFTIRSRPVLETQRAVITLRSPTGFTTSCVVAVEPPRVDRLAPRATSVKGGGTVQVVVYLNGPAPAGFAVPASSSTELAIVPERLAFPENAKYAVLTVTTKTVTEAQSATITVGGVSTDLTVTP